MGFLLLWTEDLALWLLLAALSLALASRVRRRLLRWGILLIGIVLPAAAITIVTLLFGALESQPGLQVGLFVPLLLLLLSLLAGEIVLLIWGLRRRADAPPLALHWSPGMLSLLAAGAFLAHLVTFSTLDLAVRQQMDVLRAEARVQAQSVAPLPVQNRDNAALLYQEAFDGGLLDPKPAAYETWLKGLSDDTVELRLDDPEFRAYLKQIAPLLRLVRAGTALPGCDFGRDWNRPVTWLSGAQNLRVLARDLALEARARAADGNVRGALANVLAIHRLAGHAGAEPPIISMLVAFALDAMAAESLQQILSRDPVTPDDLAVLADWRPTPATRWLQRALRMEEAFGVMTFCQVADWRDMDAIQEPLGLNGWPPNISPVYRVFLLIQDLEMYRRFMVRWQEAATESFAQREALAKQLSSRTTAGPMGIMTRLLLPALGHVHQAASRNEAHQRLCLAALACHRYRLRHGEFPATLESLLEDSSFYVPRDPYDGRPLRMARQGKSLVLYCIGPDQQDDSGTPVDETGLGPGDLVFRLRDPADITADGELPADADHPE